MRFALFFLQDTPDGEGCEVHTVVGVPDFGSRALSNEIMSRGVVGFTLRQMIFLFCAKRKIICRRTVSQVDKNGDECPGKGGKD